MNGRSIGILEGVSAVLTGGGVLSFALFPLAIPLLALTAVALLPFLVFGLALAILAAPPLLAARWLRRRAGGNRKGGRRLREGARTGAATVCRANTGGAPAAAARS